MERALVDDKLYDLQTPDEYLQFLMLPSKVDMQNFEDRHHQVFEQSQLGNHYVFKDTSEINLIDNIDDKDELELKLMGGAPGIDDESGIWMKWKLM